ncbi:MAG: hypothetical protein JXB30_08890 [Anaerolineae bacterium]|nr:hypothetical protein [Anaerolineae bacterium]
MNPNEVVSLNTEDLDVEELESRLELSAAPPEAIMGWRDDSSDEDICWSDETWRC